MRYVRIILISIFYLATINSYALKLKMSCSQDSIRIGEPLTISLTGIHDETTDFLFPDKSSFYSKWEFISKEVFPSVYLSDSLVKDSVVYKLRTFNTNDSIPLYLDVFRKRDSSRVRSNVKWVSYKSGVLKSKGNQILSDNSYEEIPVLFDEHIIISIIVIVILIASYFGFFWLPKWIKKKRIEKYKMNHLQFLNKYSFSSSWTNNEWGEFIGDWKQDISVSTKKNLQGYTSRKLSSYFNDKNLQPILMKLDRVLYDPENRIIFDKSDYDRLLNLSEKHFEKRLTDLEK